MTLYHFLEYADMTDLCSVPYSVFPFEQQSKNDSAAANRALREPETFQGIRICKGEKTFFEAICRYLVINY